MKIGVFGGCFNPPHNKHKSIATDLIENGYLDKIIFVPTGDFYNKPEIIPFNHRFNMLKLLIKNYPTLEISSLGNNPDFAYTYQVLDKMQKRYPNDKIYFICGEDNLEEFATWKRYNYILNNYKLLVIKRGEKDINNTLDKYALYINNIIIADVNSESTSSTLVRNMIKEKDSKIITELIDKEIYHYIINNNLYKKVG